MPRLLRDELEKNDRELAVAFDRIFEESLSIWEEQYLREFTTHGKRHTQQVERNLDSLTRPLQASTNPLSAEEIFVLLSATCLHDIGMQRADDPDARRKHAQYAYELIVNSYARFTTEERRVTLPIDDRNARIAIARVARAHWTEHALVLPEQEFINDQNYRGRLKLLGLLLAMADLLDLSPVRARYFRSIHRLFELPPVSQLHQTMHDLVKGIMIRPPNANVRGALQFQVEWADNNDVVHMMNDWVMQWFSSQWLQIQGTLYELSGGVINWARPWVSVYFEAPQGPVPTLSVAALNLLKAERAEQVRIDRKDFAAKFLEAIENKRIILFLFPADSGFDWRRLSEWCDATSRIQENCKVALIDLRPSSPSYFAGIIPQIMTQWGWHLPSCSDEEAFRFLENYVTDETSTLVSIIRTDEYVNEFLKQLLQTLVRSKDNTAGRVCLLISPNAQGPTELADASIVDFDGSSLPRPEVEEHLQLRRGYSARQSSEIYQRMVELELTSHPARIYTYIEQLQELGH